MRFTSGLVFALVSCASAALAEESAAPASDRAGEVSSLRAEMTDVQARIDQLATSPASAGDEESLTSMRKKGAIRIGGDVNVDLLVKNRDDSRTDSNSGDDQVNSTEFHTESANLRFRIDASPDAYLYIKLDLDDTWDEGSADQDDLLEECRYVWNKIGGSSWGLIFGKGEVPYGQDRTLGIVQSYHHNADQISSSEGPVMLLGASEEPDSAGGNPHASVGSTARPGEIDNVFLVSANYSWRNLIKAEFAVFQNNDTTGNGAMTRGMYEDRSDDTLLFESWAGRLWWTPMENLTVETSIVNKHTESRGDEDLRGDRAEADPLAFSLGAEYRIPQPGLTVFGEYQHGWDWNYFEGYDTDTWQLGLSWEAMPRLELGAMTEWLAIDNPVGNTEEDYVRLVFSAKWKFESGMHVILEYAREWWDAEVDGGPDRAREADLVGFRTGWAF